MKITLNDIMKIYRKLSIKKSTNFLWLKMIHNLILRKEMYNYSFTTYQLVPRAGLEPARRFRHGILSPECLPFHHLGIL